MEKNMGAFKKEEFYEQNLYQGGSINLRHIKILKELKKLNRNFNRILDVGCGQCRGLSFIKEQLGINEAFGLDIRKNALKDIEKFGVKEYCLDLDSEKFPFEDEYFDLIISVEVIEHLYNPDLYLSEIFRVLKRGGVFIITTPNLAWWMNLIGLSLGYQPYYTETSLNTSFGHLKGGESNSGHLRCYTLKGLSRLLEYHKFKVVKKFGIPFIWWTKLNGLKWIDRIISDISTRYSCNIGLVLIKEKEK